MFNIQMALSTSNFLAAKGKIKHMQIWYEIRPQAAMTSVFSGGRSSNHFDRFWSAMLLGVEKLGWYCTSGRDCSASRIYNLRCCSLDGQNFKTASLRAWRE
jgi:hypothetical protein